MGAGVRRLYQGISVPLGALNDGELGGRGARGRRINPPMAATFRLVPRKEESLFLCEAAKSGISDGTSIIRGLAKSRVIGTGPGSRCCQMSVMECKSSFKGSNPA